MSDLPRYCEACAEHYAAQGDADPPCEGCSNDPPLLDPGNELCALIFEEVFTCRDGMGGLSWEALFRGMALYGLGAGDQIDCLRKARVVEQVVAERREEKRKAETKHGDSSPSHPQIRRR